MKSILVAGGAGYIGSHTAKALAGAGFLPVVLDNLSTGNPWAVRWGPLVQGDIQDHALVRDVVERYRIEAVVHLAASAYVGESVIHPRKYFNHNVVNSIAFLDALLDTNIRKIVFSSTCATYGDPLTDLMSEQHPQKPVNPYGESKLFIERVIGWYGHAYGLTSMIFRYFNAAGADPDSEVGEHHDPETHLIPLAIYAALGRRECLDIYGSDYPTPDGTCVRDYVHVTDLAQAHVSAITYLLDGGCSDSMNLGTSRGHSVFDIVREVESHMDGHPLPVRIVGRRPGDPAVLVAQAGKAASVLSWKPGYSDLPMIVSTAWRWHTSRAGAGYAAPAIP